MLKKVHKFIQIFIGIFFVCLISSCKNNETYNITYELNGGILNNPITLFSVNDEIILPNPTKQDYMFVGWYDTPDFNGMKIEKIEKNTKENKVFYAKWNHERDPEGLGLNQKKFNGNGAKFGIMVLPVENFDPFNKNYNNSDKTLKQAIHKSVEKAYNIKIEYVPWSKNASYGPDRVNYIKQSFIDNSFYKKNIYAMNIDSMWVPSLVKANVIAELYNLKTDTGIFKDFQYIQSDLSNSMLNVRSNVYGYDFVNPYGDNYLYYNIDKINELGLEDPAELWFNGQWTWDRFNEWVIEAQSKLGYYGYVLDLLQGDFVNGQSAALGMPIVNLSNLTLNFNKETVRKVFERLRTYYFGGYQSRIHGTDDVTDDFLNGRTLMSTGKLSYLKNENYFNSLINFKIGVVAYPIDNNQNFKIHTSPYSYYDLNNQEIFIDQPILKRNGEVLKTKDNEPIYGINLNDTTYLNTITNNSNIYSILNYSDSNVEIPKDISFNIIYDLNNTFKSYYSLENTVNKLVDYDLDYRLIMSVQYKKCLEYDPIELVSSLINTCFSPSNWYLLSHYIVCNDYDIEETLNNYYYVYYSELENFYK